MPPTTVDELSAALREHAYLADRGLATVVHLAQVLEKPLLLEGEAGVGKTELAKVLASITGSRLIRLQCYEGIDVAHALYDWSYTRQLLYIRTLEASQAAGGRERLHELFGREFLERRPLLDAIENSDPQPPVPRMDESDRAEYQKVIGNSVDSLVTRYYETMPKISTPGDNKMPSKYAEVLIFQVRYAKGSDFRSAIAQVHEAGQKTNWPVHYEWHQLIAGGPTGVFALVIPRNTWADFEDKPDVKPFRDMLKDAFGQAEADSIVNRLDASVQNETSEIIQFRPELSYLPSK